MNRKRAHPWFFYSLVPPVIFGLVGFNDNNKFAWFLSGLSCSPALWMIVRAISAWFFPVGQMGPASPSPSRHGRLGYRGQMRRARAR